MIVLRTPELLVRIDPRHGAEILDLVDLRSGRQLLGRPPFGSEEPLAGDLDEETWTAAYRGGWQLLTPNAGNPCAVDGDRHGFHGRASNDPWTVTALGESSATLVWNGHGLGVQRRLALQDGILSVAVEARAVERRVPLVAVEHVSLGLEVLEPEVVIDLPAGRAFELSETNGPPGPPKQAPAWPEVLLLDGAVERGDRWHLEQERSRLLCVADLPEGRAVIRNAARPAGLELTWDAEWLRHLWLWHEVRTYGGPWRRRAEILVAEPASVPHSLGLAAAVEHGQALWLEPGDSVSYRLVARPLSGDAVHQCERRATSRKFSKLPTSGHVRKYDQPGRLQAVA